MAQILIFAPQYTHRSAGVRALYRLATLLQLRGVSAAIVPMHSFDAQPIDGIDLHHGKVQNRVVVYPEVVAGNPINAKRVVRWALNYPGLLGGEERYPDDDLVFVFADSMRQRTAALTGRPEAEIGTLFVPVIDPRFIYCDPAVGRDVDLHFTYHGAKLRERFPLAARVDLLSVETEASSLWHLGQLLRRCRTLYSYDHGSTVLREAIVSGCDVRVMHEDGIFRDPRSCGCAYNADWNDGFEDNYRSVFNDHRLVEPLIRRLDERWEDWRFER